MNLVEWVIRVVDAMGELGVALLLFLENIFPPIPSEVILPLAGVTVGQGEHSFLEILVAATLGALAGAYVLYGPGRWFGAERMRALFAKMPLLDVEDFDRTVEWFDRHGPIGIFLGRMVPGVRSLVSIPAGLYRMPLGQFTVLTLGGASLWNALFIWLGSLLGNGWEVIEPYTDLASKIVYVLIGVGLVWFVAKRLLHRREAHQ